MMCDGLTGMGMERGAFVFESGGRDVWSNEWLESNVPESRNFWRRKPPPIPAADHICKCLI